MLLVGVCAVPLSLLLCLLFFANWYGTCTGGEGKRKEETTKRLELVRGGGNRVLDML